MYKSKFVKSGWGIFLVIALIISMMPSIFISTTSADEPLTADVLFEGTVVLTPGDNFDVTAYNSSETYTISRTTPLGALDVAATTAGFTYEVTDKRWAYDGVLLLDNVGTYLRDKTNGIYWYAYVNDVYKDGYSNNPDGLNVIELSNGDRVDFYYAAGVADPSILADVMAAATAAVKTIVSTFALDVLFDGEVQLTPGDTFDVTAYNSETVHSISQTTPLGALHQAASTAGFTYDVTDKKMATMGIMLLDNIATYLHDSPGEWFVYVNDVYKDGWANTDDAINNLEVVHGDTVDFYYAADIADPSILDDVLAAATAAVKTIVSTYVLDVLYDGEVQLTPGETFDITAYNSETVHAISQTTPLGALHQAASTDGFTYDVTDKKMATMGIMLLDNIATYLHDSPGEWFVYVNDVYKDGWANTDDAINNLEVVHGDTVDFYYAADIADPSILDDVLAAATAAVKTIVSTGVPPTDWTLQLSGAIDTTVTKEYFEEGLACPSSGHEVFWTDDDENVWGGVPLWLLVAMIDDNPDVGPDHFNFNDDLAAQGYEVNVIAGDEWSATLDSTAIARNDDYIVANTLNGEPLPLLTEGGKPCWPLHLKGDAVFGGQQVGNIVRIELSGLPEPPEGWTLEMVGDVTDTITQSDFEDGLSCTGSGHYVEWTDINSNVWSGIPLWVLLGTVDDIETGSHCTFNDGVAAAGYTVEVIAGDDFTKTFDSEDLARSGNYIVANKMNGEELTDSWPLRLVGDGVTRLDGSLSGSSVGNIVRIKIPELQTPPAEPGSWNLTLTGKISDVISQADFEAALACPGSGHHVEWTDIDSNIWSGMPLWFLTGWVDDRQPHDYNYNQAMAGYTVLVRAEDGYTKDFSSTDVAGSNRYIIANQVNGEPLVDSWPLRLVGPGVTRTDGTLGGTSVGNIAEIELTDFQTTSPIPEVHVIKYDVDGTTILDEITVDYLWMQQNLDVIGDGTTVYRFEGITNNPDDLWDADETYPGGYKIENAVKGTRIKDLAELVGGMGSGTDIRLIASDGYETVLPYSSIYTNPSVQARQGDAILAWWCDGEYVPYYSDGMRLFFTPDGDNVYGQWDMHETLASDYWHYYYDSTDHIMYPSCAGLSAKYITTIELQSVTEGDWTLVLDGQDIGGLYYEVSKTYFEQALACQFGANHKVTYTDGDENIWEGMALWFLVGFVDDADQHSANAFNDDLALAGYHVVITASDGYSVTIDSADIIRNSDYIVANSLNGSHLPDDDPAWPLKLVGPAISGGLSISQIEEITLISIPAVNQLEVNLTAGWNTIATPISLHSDYNTLQIVLSSISYDIVYRFNAQTKLWEIPEPGDQLSPCDALYIHVIQPGTIYLIINPNLTYPPSAELYSGWNLISLANMTPLKTDQALLSIDHVEGGITGYTQVLSQAVGNQEGWIYIKGLTISDTGTEGWMKPYYGYWVFMVNGGILAGFTITPYIS